MNKRILCLETVALVAFFSTMPIYSPNVVPLQQCLQDNEAMGHFVIPMLVCAAIASAGSFAHAAMRKPLFEKLFALCSLASPLGYVLCMSYFALASIGAIPAQETLAMLCGIGIGLFLPFVAIRWGKRLVSLRLQQALLVVCIVCASTAAINWAFSFSPPVLLASLFIAMTAFGSFFPCIPSATKRPEHAEAHESENRENTPRCANDSKGEAKTADQGGAVIIPRFVSVLIPALIGLSVFAVHMGVSRESILDSISAEILGNVIASLALVPLCFIKSRQQPVSVLLFSGVAPTAAILLLCYLAIANDFAISNDFISTGIYTFFCMIAQISLALGIAGTHAREFSAPMIWSGFLFLFTTFSVLGLSFGAFLSDGQPFMPQTITALYCAYLVVQSIRSLWTNGLSRFDGDKKHANEESDYARRCDKLAADFSLSPREKEIVTYLGRGHTCSYIAKTLVISESTVYTHARNIYRKVGIQSKEELIQILASPS